MSGRRVLVGAPSLPAYDREAGWQRVHDFVGILLEQGWSVVYVAKNRAPGDERYARPLRQAGVAVFHADEVDMASLVAAGRFDLALFAFWHIGELWLPLVRRLSPATRIVVDSIDLHFVRHARQRLGGPGGGRPLDAEYASQSVREINTYVAADAVLAVSDAEAGFLNQLVGSDDLARVVDQMVPEAPPAPDPVLHERRGMLFVGNFRHPPNIEAAAFMFEEVVPRLSPSVLEAHPVVVVGNALDDRVRALADGLAHVELVGWVPSLVPYLQGCAVSVVPLLHGAGTKRKVIEALLAGLPVVSTSIGVEGLPLRAGEHAMVADDAAGFADAVSALLGNAGHRAQLAEQGRRQVLAELGRSAVAARFSAVLEDVLVRPAKPAAFAQEHCQLHRPNLHQDYWTYRNLVTRLRDVLRTRLPAGATAAVLSKGDDDLVEVEGLDLRHFPAGPDGRYAGFHPSDSAAAITHLREQMAMGVSHLLVPATADWWLAYYEEFGQLLSRCTRVHEEDGAGVLFALEGLPA